MSLLEKIKEGRFMAIPSIVLIVSLIPGSYIGIVISWILFLDYFSHIFSFLPTPDARHGWVIAIILPLLPIVAIPHFFAVVYIIFRKLKLPKWQLVVFSVSIIPVLIGLITLLFLM